MTHGRSYFTFCNNSSYYYRLSWLFSVESKDGPFDLGVLWMLDAVGWVEISKSTTQSKQKQQHQKNYKQNHNIKNTTKDDNSNDMNELFVEM